MFPSVAFPTPAVIFPTCANGGVVIDNPPVVVAITDAKAAAATNIAARIPLFKLEVIDEVRIRNYMSVV
jgi:hypothetical protein